MNRNYEVRLASNKKITILSQAQPIIGMKVVYRTSAGKMVVSSVKEILA